jgi:glucosyl-3-phosphoglycerate synthase
VLSTEVFRTLKAAYYRAALDLVDWYHHDAVLNGLEQDRHSEEQVVEMFSGALMTAGEQFLSNPMETPFMPSWSRVVSAVPDVLDRIAAAVEADNTA